MGLNAGGWRRSLAPCQLPRGTRCFEIDGGFESPDASGDLLIQVGVGLQPQLHEWVAKRSRRDGAGTQKQCFYRVIKTLPAAMKKP